MKQQISGKSFSERKVGLWTPWGILRLPDPDNAEHEPRRRLPALRGRSGGGARPVRVRDLEPLA